RLAVDLRHLSSVRTLAIDYVHRFDALADFYAGDPADPAAWSDAIRRTRAHRRRSEELAAILASQQQRRNAPAAAVEAARRLASPDAVAVVTGQQAGLFGGPLYTLFKAITAIQLAERVSQERGVDAVPVFWIDAEDHDWDEVRSCTVFDQSASPQEVALPSLHTAQARPVASIQLTQSIDEA